MRARGCQVERVPLASEAAHGTFVAPTIIELDDIAQLEREVFGPVLHVVRYRRQDMDRMVDAINATGYGLTFGLHTRLDETVAAVLPRVHAGNLYVNRNVIGAVVGVQPFGGRGLSGTGPKAGGPLYLGRLVSGPAFVVDGIAGRETEIELAGPVGERNLYAHRPRGRILLLPTTQEGLREQVAAVLATGNDAVVCGAQSLRAGWADLPADWQARVSWSENARGCHGVLIEGDPAARLVALRHVAAMPGPILLPQAAPYRSDWLVEEVSTSINTTAAGGNASLMTLV
jgi:RHH-type proline utilization regulon transcriptional repressor/proline dehydrogenase/delta 1-pyrroline-5-carboxylate dehydrogenase